ncbi:MAG TPA: hypothetical protein VF841_11315 [Anaeromyxobacter sp.]
MLPSLLVLTTAIVIGAPSAAPIAELSMGMLRAPDLALHLRDPGPRDGTPSLDGAPRRQAGGPVCSGDVCEPAVSVPGFEPSYGRAHRSEAFVALLTRAHIEPIATLAWALVATGLRFDWTPVALEGPRSGGHGWGTVVLRLRLRIDAQGGVVIPPRPE